LLHAFITLNQEVAAPAAEPAKAAPTLGKSGKKICCSCPETKKLRDECVVGRGEEHCADLIEAHKACLRAEGFTVK
jgi:cytochrome c oxidase assembly protein subunit 17